MRQKVIGRQDELIWQLANCGSYSAVGCLNPSEQEHKHTHTHNVLLQNKTKSKISINYMTEGGGLLIKCRQNVLLGCVQSKERRETGNEDILKEGTKNGRKLFTARQ
jgi:hypothetical protein